MVGLIALGFCFLVIWQLFRLNREENVQTSKALWIPTFWLFIAASRNVSQWLQYSGSGADQYLEGSPLDRAVLSAVLALGLVVLFSRAGRTSLLLRSNLPILIYFFYCGISFIWSDFPDVSFKRWFRAMGDVVIVLIVLSDLDWVAAMRRLLTRVGFVVAPLSIVFIRYFPQMGRSYTHAGGATWTGVATDKNGLGMICLIFGLASIFRFLELYRVEKASRQRRPLIAHGLVILMSLYLLWEANSATASSCFFLAVIPMMLTYIYPRARKPAFVNTMVSAALGVAFSALFLSIGSGMVQNLGRDTTLTGRTNIWHFSVGLVQNPLLGAGFESFWLGPRLKQMTILLNQGVNQAHNGYIEVYLNLGWVGVVLLAFILITGYRRILAAVREMAPMASLRLAYFIVAVVYNFTEAGFKMMHPVWLSLLLVTMIVPELKQPEQPPSPGIRPLEEITKFQPRPTRSAVRVKQAVRA